jgi:microtubule-associated serine/threonine kinase
VDTPEADGVRELVEFAEQNRQKKIANPTTPESSQTESDDVSPQIQRKRRLHTRDSLPRFSISIEDNRCRSVNYEIM